jgi:hypothetical protein
VQQDLEVRPALVMRPALPPGPGPLLLWFSRLIQHDRDKFSCLGAGARILTRCEHTLGGKVGPAVPLGAVMPTICDPVLRNCPLILVLQIKLNTTRGTLLAPKTCMKLVIKCYRSRDVDGQKFVVRTINISSLAQERQRISRRHMHNLLPKDQECSL